MSIRTRNRLTIGKLVVPAGPILNRSGPSRHPGGTSEAKAVSVSVQQHLSGALRENRGMASLISVLLV